MAVDFVASETKDNLMRAFAGESQARNRYTFAAKQAKNQNLHVIEAIFTFTASQEEQHAKIYYDHLAKLAGQTIKIDGTYPVDINNSISNLLHSAQHNEYEEHDPVYKTFAQIATKEGFTDVASSFSQIAEIEKTHGDRFGMFADLMDQNRLFVSEIECKWMCLNCGHIFEGKEAPAICPVCKHNQGYFVRVELAPYTQK